MEEIFSLDWINQEYVRFKRTGRTLTDLVLGEKEMEIVKDWGGKCPYRPINSKTNPIPLPESVRKAIFTECEIFGIQLHIVESPESYWRSYDLYDEKDEQEFQKEKLQNPKINGIYFL